MSGRTHDLGQGFTLSEFLTKDGELVGYTVSGPAAAACPSPYSGRCGGLCAVREHEVPMGGGRTRRYSVWQASGEWPNVTLSPSVMCSCNGQHGWVRDGVWVNV